MPDEYWTKIGSAPKPKKPAGPRYVPVPPTRKAASAEGSGKAASADERKAASAEERKAASAEKSPDGSELFWCGACKAGQVEKKRWARDKDAHVRCRGCGRVIYPKHERVGRVLVVKLCKHCQAPLRKGNGSGECSLCSRT